MQPIKIVSGGCVLTAESLLYSFEVPPDALGQLEEGGGGEGVVGGGVVGSHGQVVLAKQVPAPYLTGGLTKPIS